MTRVRKTWGRKVAALTTMGFLLQAGGCTVDPNAVLQSLAGLALNSLLSGLGIPFVL